VLEGASATIAGGTFAAICGPSGSGKSTLLLVLGALLHADGGDVIIGGENLLAMQPEPRARRRAELLGYVFQRFHLVPYLTVEENILAASIALPGEPDRERATELMDRFQITGRRRHVPGRLSVGEQQRTALARALFNRPGVLLADEPTGNLDPENANIVLHAFADFASGGGTVVMVTHHPEAAEKADRRWWIRDRKLVAE
jgi:putative ABC transport system ATP-binding protein